MQRPQPTGQHKSLQPEDFIVSKTDLKGKITYGNKIFLKLSGYDEKELLGAPHSILRHPDMPKIIFKLLWDRIQAKQEIFAYVKNLCKDGAYYWVLANVTTSLDTGGAIRGYYSVRRKPTDAYIAVIEPLYRDLLAAEHSGGMNASKALLDQFLNQKGVTYDQFVLQPKQ